MNNHDNLKNTFNEVYLSKEIFDKIKRNNKGSSEYNLSQIRRAKNYITIKYMSLAAGFIMVCLILTGVLINVSVTGGSGNKYSDINNEFISDKIDDFDYMITFRDSLGENRTSPQTDAGIVTESGRIYLVIGGVSNIKLDVTDRLKNGYLRDTISIGDKVYVYEIVELDEKYDLHIYEK